MKIRRFAASSMSIVLAFTTGCSCFVPSHQMVSVTVAEPAHAGVWINGEYKGEAPVQVSLLRSHDFGVMVKKEGYQTSTQIVGYHLNTTGILDVVGTCLFLIPCIGLMTSGSDSLDE